MTDRPNPSSIPRIVLLILVPAVMSFLVLAITTVSYAQPLRQAPDGEILFKEKCAACHTIGAGDKVGPDLQGVTERRSTEWLTQWLLRPDQMLASGDPIAAGLLEQYKNIPMPNLGLTTDQAKSLITFMGSGTSVSNAPPPAGNAAAGRAFFVGTARFENRGPQCMSCHSIAGIGALGGGNLGPDLTANGYNKYGDGLAAFLGSPATVTMNAVWKDRPLTPQEQADLYAFMKESSVSGRPTQALWQIALLSIAGAAALIASAQAYWGKRLKGVRRPMIERAYAVEK